MTQTSTAGLLDLVGARRGHFGLESGHHSQLWLDLDTLFADHRPIEPFVTRLADALRPHQVSVVCGPLLGGAFLAQLLARRLGVEFCFAEREMPAEARGLFRVRYHIPRALAARVAGKRLAIVDDVMSAGSALRGTYADLQALGATCAVAGALLVLGSTGSDFFARGDPGGGGEPSGVRALGACALSALRGRRPSERHGGGNVVNEGTATMRTRPHRGRSWRGNADDA